MSDMRAKESRFVDEYLVDLNATQAAIRAGYAPSTAAKKAPLWVAKSKDKSTKPHVWDAVQEGMKHRAERVGVDAVWVVAKLREVVERCMKPKPVLDKKGNHTGEYRFEHNGAIKALETLARHLGMFREETAPDHSNSIEEALMLIEEREAKLLKTRAEKQENDGWAC